MSADCFLDTNILVYSFDASSKKKQKISLDLVEQGLVDGSAFISWQVVQEFLNVATRRFPVPLSISQAKHYFSKVLKPLCRLQSQSELYLRALSVKDEYNLSFYDCLIVSSALSLGVDTLYSEDFQNGQRIGAIKIVNPFI